MKFLSQSMLTPGGTIPVPAQVHPTPKLTMQDPQIEPQKHIHRCLVQRIQLGLASQRFIACLRVTSLADYLRSLYDVNTVHEGSRVKDEEDRQTALLVSSIRSQHGTSHASKVSLIQRNLTNIVTNFQAAPFLFPNKRKKISPKQDRKTQRNAPFLLLAAKNGSEDHFRCDSQGRRKTTLSLQALCELLKLFLYMQLQSICVLLRVSSMTSYCCALVEYSIKLSSIPLILYKTPMLDTSVVVRA